MSTTLNGVLEKQGTSWPRTWKRRYFAYDQESGEIQYWASAEKRQLRGARKRVLRAFASTNESTPCKFEIAIEGRREPMQLEAETTAEMQRWCSFINASRHSLEELAALALIGRVVAGSSDGGGDTVAKQATTAPTHNTSNRSALKRLGKRVSALFVPGLPGRATSHRRRQSNADMAPGQTHALSLGRDEVVEDVPPSAVADAEHAPPPQKILLVLGHPNVGKSTNHAIAAEAARFMRSHGREVRIVDLFDIGWNPMPSVDDFEVTAGDASVGASAASQTSASGGDEAKHSEHDAGQGQKAGFLDYQMWQKKASTGDGLKFTPQIAEQIDHAVWADAIVFQFPLYWFGVPAAISSWVDKVLAYWTFYGGGRSPLQGKRWMVSVTTGAPEDAYTADGYYSYSLDELLAGFNELTPLLMKMEVLPMLRFHAGRQFNVQQAYLLNRVRSHLLEHIIGENCKIEAAWDARMAMFTARDAQGLSRAGPQSSTLLCDPEGWQSVELVTQELKEGGYRALLEAQRSARGGRQVNRRERVLELQSEPFPMVFTVWADPNAGVRCAVETLWLDSDGTVLHHNYHAWGRVIRGVVHEQSEVEGALATVGDNPLTSADDRASQIALGGDDKVSATWSRYQAAIAAGDVDAALACFRLVDESAGDGNAAAVAQILCFERTADEQKMFSDAAGVRAFHEYFFGLLGNSNGNAPLNHLVTCTQLHPSAVEGAPHRPHTAVFDYWRDRAHGIDCITHTALLDDAGLIVKMNVIMELKHPVICAWDHHFACFFARDAINILRDYVDGSQLVSYDVERNLETCGTGVSTLASFFSNIFAIQRGDWSSLASPVMDVTTLADHSTVYWVWQCESAGIPLASVSLFFDDTGAKVNHFASIWSNVTSDTDTAEGANSGGQVRQLSTPATSTVSTGGPVQSVWDAHLAGLKAKNMDKCVAMYASTSKLIVYDQIAEQKTVYEGATGARDMFTKWFQNMSDLSDFKSFCTKITEAAIKYVDMQPVQNGGGTAYMVWECPASGVTKATTTILFDKNHKVVAQHVTMHTTWSKHRTFTNRVDHDLLTVHRTVSDAADAFMDADDQVALIMPGKCYKVGNDTLEEVSDFTQVATASLPPSSEPPHLVLPNTWGKGGDFTGGEAEANILGGNVLFETELGEYTVPHGHDTAAEFAWFGAHLVPIGSEVVFDTPKAVPVWTMTVGDRYVEDYLLKDERGGGFYMEYHNCPHLHVPMEKEATGFVILGKKTDDDKFLMMTAFHIPFGFGLYMPPGTIHCDAFLTGKYMVGYTNAPSFSTAIFRTQQGAVTQIKIWCLKKCKVYNLADESKLMAVGAASSTAEW